MQFPKRMVLGYSVWSLGTRNMVAEFKDAQEAVNWVREQENPKDFAIIEIVGEVTVDDHILRPS